MSNSSNLVKSYFLVRDNEEPRIIDSNSSSEEKLERLRMIYPVAAEREDEYEDSEPGVFSGGLDAATLDLLMDDAIPEEEYEDGQMPVSNVIKVAPDGEGDYSEDDYGADYSTQASEPVFDGPSPEELIAQANEQIEEMKRVAQAQIELEKTEVLEDARQQGFAQGYDEGAAKADELRAALEEEKRALEQRYEEQLVDMEPVLVHAITSVYERVFSLELSEYKPLVTSMLHNALMSVEMNKNYLIHVSRDDYQYVAEHKSELYTDSMTEDTVIDIVEDALMKTGDCLIETSSGIFDCGLGTQLANIRKKLELLSYTHEN